MSEPLAALLGLERQLRQAGTLAQLGFAIVNQTRSCIPYTQAVLLRGGGQTLRVVAASVVVVAGAILDVERKASGLGVISRIHGVSSQSIASTGSHVSPGSMLRMMMFVSG